MTHPRTMALIEQLLNLPAETSWVEFKHNNFHAPQIGKLISALSNAARLADEHCGYIIWGIEDGARNIVGTTFDASSETYQQQPYEFWLAQRLKPSINLSFETIAHSQGRLVLLKIPAASVQPIAFEDVDYIRIGSATPPLKEYPERLRALWQKLQPYVWEDGIAVQFISGDEVLKKIDYASYFDLTSQPLPDNKAGILEKLKAEKIILDDVGGNWNITNLGAILFAKNLDDFDISISRKAVRFVVYDGNGRNDTVIKRRDGQKGYANGFKGLIDFISATLPLNEHIGAAFRTEVPVYPLIALRELIANSLIHQDLTITGTSPLIELFKDRLEITNPGHPLIDPQRFIDLPPRSRNERLAALMRRMKICEEQGTGIDKVIATIELFQLPPPDFRIDGDSVRVVLYAPRKFSEMTNEERIRACYQHAALKFISGDKMKNSSLRERFGIEEQNAAQVSVVIKQALEQNQIKSANPEKPQAGYVPFWA